MSGAGQTSRQGFGLALQFMTRLPVPWQVSYSETAQAASARFYPAVGLVVGLIAALVFLLAHWMFTPVIAGFLAIAAGIAVTGGLHEDGLADSADGLGSGAPRDRALEIMRDSSVGVFGVLALLIALPLKALALAELPALAGAIALICGHGLSRYACVFVIRNHPYARSSSVKFAKPQIDGAGHRFAALWALGFVLLLLVGFGLAGFTGLALAGALTFALLRRAMARLEGYTGDILGASQQLCELGLYLGLLIWL